jgi:3-oxoacyl-[acyl-carrier protein] reductase
MSDLKGKVAVVTDASKGIGAAIAKGLSAAGKANSACATVRQ